MLDTLNEKIRGIMAHVLQIPQDQITPQSKQSEIPEWDSFHHMDLVMALEENFGVRFSDDEVVKMTEFSLIATILRKHVGQN